jgi:DNA-directed RNA polymerase III subunit RPC1
MNCDNTINFRLPLTQIGVIRRSVQELKMEKEQYRSTFYGMKLSDLVFTVPTAQDIRKQGQINCFNKLLYNNGSKKPAANGVLDLRLGTSQKDSKCETCGQGLADCVGHFGYIDLKLPVFHVGYFRYIVNILQCICKKCSRILLTPNDRYMFSLKLQKPELGYLEKKGLQKAINERCKKTKYCVFCKSYNGTVKKLPLFKIIHVNTPLSKQSKEKLVEDYVLLIENNRDIDEYIEKNKAESLDPIRVDALFSRILEEDLQYLLITNFHPRDLVLWRINVPPPCIRPSVLSDKTSMDSNEDDLTLNLKDLVFISEIIHQHTSSGLAGIPMVMEHWEYLQRQYALYINSETPLPLHMKPKKASRGLVQRLKGKHGRFRGNLSGKRVDFSARSVISPNPNLKIDEVGVPVHIAKILTYPEQVTPANIERMRKLILNGAEKHPGANFYQERKTQAKIFLKYGNRAKLAAEIKCGDMVERHMDDDDLVLFNRQPSLHKLSIMCHRVRVHAHRTLQFNECVCTPYNADFDGDEMNLHLPQTEEARAEALVLMGTKSNIITPRNGEPLIAAIQDFITGGYLLTQKNLFLDRKKAMQIIGSILSHYPEKINLPPPMILKPVALWTGKQIFSLIMRPSDQCGVKVHLRTKTKNYTGATALYEDEFAVNDSFVCIRDSELLAGCMDKSTLGSGSKNNVFYVILRDFGGEECSGAMWRLARVASYFLQNRGFSLGIDDVTPTPGLLQAKRNLLSNGYEKVDEIIQSLNDDRLETLPGMTPEESSEAQILKELSFIRDHAGKECLRNLSRHNSALIMAICGSKGSFINVSQMVACVGQQALRGSRVPDGFGDRSLPHFPHKDKSPSAKGFVENSFYSGLTPTEFFFHTMAGREGLLDTAVKTAETGYMQRRLVKALEDLVTHYDGSVRNSRGEVVQLIYGDDGLDPVEMEANSQPVDLERTFAVCAPKKDSSDPVVWLDSIGVRQIVDVQMKKWRKSGVGAQFIEFVGCFCAELQRKLDQSVDIRARYSLAPISYRLDEKHLLTFLDSCQSKYLRARLDPASAVGAICAQSIGEPATQMTLKTFHFAGVASMNITQGVPRIKELMNANRTIETPVVTAALLPPASRDQARAVKMRLEKTTLEQVCQYIEQVVLTDDCFIKVKLYLERIQMLKLEVNVQSIQELIMKSTKITADQVQIISKSTIIVRAPVPSEMWMLQRTIASLVVKGISSVKRAAIRVDNVDADKHYLVIEGDGLGDVMATYGVDSRRTISNNVLEVARTLGIEAARTTIIREFKCTMEEHGISIDNRHLMLLADLMTYRGEVLGITRFGLAKMKESALMLASVCVCFCFHFVSGF